MELKKYRGKYCVYWRDPRGPQRRSLGTSDPATANERFSEFTRTMELRRRASGLKVQELWEARRKALEGRRLSENMVWSGKRLLPVFGHLRASEVTKDLVRKYTLSRDSKPGTIWTELNHLRMTLLWAKKEGLLPEAPEVPMPRRPLPKSDYLTKEQAHDYLRCLEFPHLRLFTYVALATGARRSAILELTWSQVDFERKLVDFTTYHLYQKGRSLVPINDTLLVELQSAKAVAQSEYVIEYSGQRVLSVSKGLKSAAHRAGLPFVSPHVFRHSAAVWMAEDGIDMEVISQFLGHSNPDVTRRVYARYSPTYLRSAASALEF